MLLLTSVPVFQEYMISLSLSAGAKLVNTHTEPGFPNTHQWRRVNRVRPG